MSFEKADCAKLISKFGLMGRLISFFVVVLLLSGCKKEEEPVAVSYQLTADIRIPANLQIAIEHKLESVSAFNPTDSVLSANSMSLDQVKSVLIDSIYITNNDTFNTTGLNFLREIELELEGGNEPKLLIGASGELPEMLSDSIGLHATTRSLETFLSGDSVLIWPSVLTDQSILAATDLEVVMELTLTAK